VVEKASAKTPSRHPDETTFIRSPFCSEVMRLFYHFSGRTCNFR
jgi:hypothetical protein